MKMFRTPIPTINRPMTHRSSPGRGEWTKGQFFLEKQDFFWLKCLYKTCISENEDAEQATVPTETETSAEAKEDGKDEEKNKSTLISNCGNIDVGLEYALTNKRITVTILECTDLPNQDRGVPPIIQVSKIFLRKNNGFKVRIEMFPSKRKYKTKVQHVDSPRFNECFKVPRVNPDDVEKMGCRIR